MRVDARVPPAVRLEVVRVEDTPEVRPQLGMLGEVLGPVVGGFERVAVEVAADVDARARVAVLPPRAAGTAVLLDDRERQLRLGEPERGQQPRFAAADDDDVRVGAHVVGDLVGPRDRARVGTVEVQVLEEHRDDVVVERRAREERHHLADELVGRRRREHAPAVAELEDRGERPRGAPRPARPPTCRPCSRSASTSADAGRCGSTDGSPVRCTIEQSSAGTLRSSRAAAMVASSSVKGRPACGLCSDSDMGRE